MNLRKVFFEHLIELAENDRDIILITNDVGYSYFETFQEKYPGRFINAGIMEQSIMGIAAGLALAGKKPYVYSMIPFVLMRCYEQLRNDVCYQNLNVKVIGVAGKESYKFLGYSHNIAEDEDLQILAPLPNIVSYVPKDHVEVVGMMNKSYQEGEPSYTRL